jgi:hypothetical protein
MWIFCRPGKRRACFYSVLAVGAALLCINTQSEEASINAKRLFEFSFAPESSQSTWIQASTDLVNWTIVATNQPRQDHFTDLDTGRFAFRFYRVVPSIVGLEASPNTVFMPGEGFNTLQFAPDGRLALIRWTGRDLVYSERDRNEAWSRESVCECGLPYKSGIREEYRFQPSATLLFDDSSTPQILGMGREGSNSSRKCWFAGCSFYG